jgi:hypothetical protein
VFSSKGMALVEMPYFRTNHTLTSSLITLDSCHKKQDTTVKDIEMVLKSAVPTNVAPYSEKDVDGVQLHMPPSERTRSQKISTWKVRVLSIKSFASSQIWLLTARNAGQEPLL